MAPAFSFHIHGSSFQMVLFFCSMLLFVVPTARGTEVNAACDSSDLLVSSEQASIACDDVSLVQVQKAVHVRVANRGSSAGKIDPYTTTTEDPAAVPDTELAKISAIALNTAADLDALLASLKLDIMMILFCLGFFTVAVRYYPNIYAFRATGAWNQEKQIDAPITWSPDDRDWFRWVKASYSVTFEDMIRTCGLDAAMFIRFTMMGMEIMLGVFIPNFFVCSMLFCFVGPNVSGKDKLSYFGVGNIETGSWVFWPVAFMVWYNVIFIQFRLFKWQRFFIKYRCEWLLAMPSPRDCTILVEGIEDEYCSDEMLKKYFQEMYGEDEIKEAFVVKKIHKLEGLIEEWKTADDRCHQAQYHKQQHGEPLKFHINGSDQLEYYTKEKARLKQEISDEQAVVMAEARKAPQETTIYGTNGFVTFKSRHRVEQAMTTRLRADDGSFMMSIPPDPSDVIHKDLEMPVAEQEFLQIIGWGMVAGLFFTFMPIVLGISNLATIENLEKIEFFKKAFSEGGSLESMKSTIQGQLASLGLTFMMSMLPTFLMWIFNGFFYLVAYRWAQLELQKFYFWFLIIFVLFTTAIGSSLFDTLEELAQSPFKVFTLFADKVPMTSHFYMNYVIMQWVTHAMNMLRYMPLAKYFIFSRFYDREVARALAEPEDQDYYGIGSRSAQFSLMLITGITFSTISPLVSFLVFINFFVCRSVYGYLIPFAETRKGDLGGLHWALQLDHIHEGVLLYIILMVGILATRAPGYGPVAVGACSFIWWAISFYKFTHKLHWGKLPFQDVVRRNTGADKRKPTRGTYHQLQLEADICEQLEIK